MHANIRLSVAVFVCAFHVATADPAVPGSAPDTSNLQVRVEQAVAAVTEQFSARKLATNQIAVTCMDLRDPSRPVTANYRGDVPIYPASVVKLFYLAAVHRWLEDGQLQDSAELRRAMKDMIVQSYNEATHYVLDCLTDTTSGPELPPQQMKEWTEKRNAVNRYFATQGYESLNLNQKPWCEGPYGRERIFVGQNFDNRNQLTTAGTARLLSRIARREEVSAAASEQMLELLKREPTGKGDSQATDYIGSVLPKGARLWSKAGWTSSVRHDAAYIEMPDGGKFVLVIFTTGHASERGIIPAFARRVLVAP